MRAYCIVKYMGVPYIIKQFDHKNDTALLSRWKLPLTEAAIRSVTVYNLPTDLTLDNSVIKTLDILFEW